MTKYDSLYASEKHYSNVFLNQIFLNKTLDKHNPGKHISKKNKVSTSK